MDNKIDIDMTEEELKLISFLTYHKKMKKLFVFCSLFSFFVGIIVIFACFVNYKERFLWESLVFIFIGFLLLFLNRKFIKLYDLFNKIIENIPEEKP